jgi:hypothetical protein
MHPKYTEDSGKPGFNPMAPFPKEFGPAKDYNSWLCKQIRNNKIRFVESGRYSKIRDKATGPYGASFNLGIQDANIFRKGFISKYGCEPFHTVKPEDNQGTKS